MKFMAEKIKQLRISMGYCPSGGLKHKWRKVEYLFWGEYGKDYYVYDCLKCGKETPPTPPATP